MLASCQAGASDRISFVLQYKKHTYAATSSLGRAKELVVDERLPVDDDARLGLDILGWPVRLVHRHKHLPPSLGHDRLGIVHGLVLRLVQFRQVGVGPEAGRTSDIRKAASYFLWMDGLDRSPFGFKSNKWLARSHLGVKGGEE